MLHKNALIISLLGFIVIGVLLPIHPGFAVKLSNYIFLILFLMVIWGFVNNEDS